YIVSVLNGAPGRCASAPWRTIANCREAYELEVGLLPGAVLQGLLHFHDVAVGCVVVEATREPEADTAPEIARLVAAVELSEPSSLALEAGTADAQRVVDIPGGGLVGKWPRARMGRWNVSTTHLEDANTITAMCHG